MKQQIHFLLATSLSILLASCECEPLYLVDGSTFGFRLIDEPTGKNLFTNRFDPFELEIIDENGDTVDIDAERYGQGEDYYFLLDPTGDQILGYDRQALQTYYLVFDSTDTDTLELFFVPRRDDCEEYMDNFQAYYNDSLVFAESGESYYQALSILKP